MEPTIRQKEYPKGYSFLVQKNKFESFRKKKLCLNKKLINIVYFFNIMSYNKKRLRGNIIYERKSFKYN